MTLASLFMDLFNEIADERRITADFLEVLTEEQLSTQSLCHEWTVKEVGGHLLMPLVTPMPKFMIAMARHRMNFDRASAGLSKQVARRSRVEIVSGLRANAGSRFTPPGLGPEAPLADVLIHGQDMRRPLGLTREFVPERLEVVLHFLVSGRGGKAFVPASRVVDLEFRATDIAWSAGSGRAVVGPAEAILMAVAGRPVGLDELSGDGVVVLRERLTE